MQAFNYQPLPKKPVRIWLAFQKMERTQDSQVINKRVFDLLGSNQVQIRYNQKIYPMFQYLLTYPPQLATGIPLSTSGMPRVYKAFMDSGYKMHGYDGSSIVDINAFQSNYPIFFFDLEDQDEDLFKSAKAAEIQVYWSNTATTFGAPNGYHVYTIVESERLIRFKGISGSMALVL